MKILLLCFTCALGLSHTGAHAGSLDERAIVQLIKDLEQQRLAAGVRKDVDAIASATADSYMQIDLDGKVLDKGAALARIKSSYARLTANPVDEIVVRVFGDTAVLTGRAAPQGTIDGREQRAAMRYTRVYAKVDGRWQVVHFQQTRLSESGHEEQELLCADDN